MIVSCITDGLGNQLFQYAAGKSLALNYNVPFKLDNRYFNYRGLPVTHKYYLDRFNVQADFITNSEIVEYTGLSNTILHKIIRKINPAHQKNNPNHIYSERFFHYDEDLNKAGDKLYLRGYWQSYKYFQNYDYEIRKDFSFTDKIDREADPFAKSILNTQSVCISVRRGDYISSEVNRSKFCHCSAEYYAEALRVISSKVNDLHIYVFSDDIEWCEANLVFNYPMTFVKNSNKPFDYFLQLMTFCKHFIIPNSTFPWWGAWLSSNENKIVVSPKCWFADKTINTNDLIPPAWYRI